MSRSLDRPSSSRHTVRRRSPRSFRRRIERGSYLARSLGSLPLAFAVARVGCLFAGCCHGTPTDTGWGWTLPGTSGGVHPTPLYEIAGLVALRAMLIPLPSRWIAPTVLFGFGAIRLAVEPFRAPPPLGAPLLDPLWIGAAWIGVAAALACAMRDTRRPRGRGKADVDITLVRHAPPQWARGGRTIDDPGLTERAVAYTDTLRCWGQP